MIVGICAPYDLGQAGGVNSHIRAQARALAQRGHKVCVFGAASRPVGPGELAVSGCLSFVIRGTETPIGYDLRAWRRVGRLLRSRRFDILHIHEPFMPIVPLFALLRAEVPIVATFHVHREDGHPFYPWFQPILSPLMRRIAVRIAVSEAARRTVAEHFPGDYQIVPNGIDCGAFQAPRPRPEAFIAGRRHVLVVGRLEPRKGIEHLIRAMARGGRVARDARLVVVGDGPERAPLEALARAEGADVVFGGRVSDDDLPAWYQASDIVCSPAVGDESFGIVLLEAMACARPIVASRIDGYSALVDGTGCARLVTPGDSAALAGALSELLDNPEARRTLGARGRQAAQGYDWSTIAERLERIYRSLTAAAPR